MRISKKFQEFLIQHLRQILHVARLNHFDIYVQGKQSRYAADIMVDYTYLRAYLRLGKEVHQQWRVKQYDKILQTLCHEIAHIITGIPCHLCENREDIEEQEEQATEMTGRILFRLYKEELK